MKRSLGDKRRFLDDAAIESITREHGAMSSEDRSRMFDNEDFGYRRVTVERPLRLCFQITSEATERFLDACPELLDALRAVEDKLGSEPLMDWNQAWEQVQKVVKHLPVDMEGWASGAKGAAQRKIFRECFTSVHPEAVPVIAKRHSAVAVDDEALFPQPISAEGLDEAGLHALLGLYADGQGKHIEYESDPALRDAENIPLKEDVVGFFLREVRPYVPDAWIDRETLDEQDRGIGKVGYEINFNRVFFQYQPPRSLKVIDAELAEVEQRIMNLLREVTE
jgi:type I restriction enzyme M protein